MSAVAEEIRVRLPVLHRGQVKIAHQAKRYNVLACGRRFGKSVFGLERLIHPVLNGFEAAYFCPTNKMLRKTWKQAKRILEPVTKSRSEQDHIITLVTGGTLEMWSLVDQETSRGSSYKRLVVDEAAMIPDLLGLWNAVLRPTLTDYKGDAWFLSTPKGLNGFHTMFERGADPEKDAWKSWQMPTTTNPYIDPAEIQECEETTPSDLFRQEYLAQFISAAGAVFRNLASCLVLDESTPAAHAGHRLVMGVDWAQAHDFTVLSVGCATCRQEVALDRFNKIDYGVQRDRLSTMAKRWGVTDILAEENSIGKPNIDQLYREGLPVRGFQTTAQSKGPLVQSMALALEREEFHWLSDAVARAELLSYEAKINPVTNRVTYSAPTGQHDDTVIARCLMLQAAMTTPIEFDWS